MVDLGQDLDVIVRRNRRAAAGLAEVARQVAKVLGARLDRNASRFLDDRSKIALAIPGQDHAIDALGNVEVAGDPPGRHERGHRDRQHGDLGRETSPRGQLVEHLPQRELGQAAGDEEEMRAIRATIVVHVWPHQRTDPPQVLTMTRF